MGKLDEPATNKQLGYISDLLRQYEDIYKETLIAKNHGEYITKRDAGEMINCLLYYIHDIPIESMKDLEELEGKRDYHFKLLENCEDHSDGLVDNMILNENKWLKYI